MSKKRKTRGKRSSKKKEITSGSNTPNNPNNPHVDDDDEATESDDLSKDPPKPKGSKAKKKMYSREEIDYFDARSMKGQFMQVISSGIYLNQPDIVKELVKGIRGAPMCNK